MLIITFCPAQKRFKTSLECSKIILSEFQQKINIYNQLMKFNKIKYVDLTEPTDTMEKDEKELYEKNRLKERNLIFQELHTIDMNRINTDGLKLYILNIIYDVDKKKWKIYY